MTATDQTIKADKGKLRLTLVPTMITKAIALVREYGVHKYKEKESWKTVEIERYRDAAYRHFLAYIEDPTGVDADSGLTHTEHLLANAVFLNDCVAAGRIPPSERP